MVKNINGPLRAIDLVSNPFATMTIKELQDYILTLDRDSMYLLEAPMTKAAQLGLPGNVRYMIHVYSYSSTLKLLMAYPLDGVIRPHRMFTLSGAAGWSEWIEC